MNPFFLLSLLCAVHVHGQSRYCCTSPQWESTNYVREGKTDHGVTSIITIDEKTAVDQNARMIASTFTTYVNGTMTPTVKLLQDFNSGKQYALQSGKCSVTALPPWTPRCVPDSARLLESSYYGVGQNRLKVDVYEVITSYNTVYLTFTKQDCMPVYQSGYGSKDGVSAVSVKAYTNITLGIADRHVFDIPPGC